jgi:hypothetical protein
MAVEEKKVIVEDEFSDENYMIGDESESAYISKKGDFEYDRAESQAEKDAVTLGSGIQNMEDWQVASRQQDRLKNEAFEKLPELQKENEQLKVDNAKYKIDLKGKALPPPEKLVDVDTSSLSSFATSVGDSFMNIASVIPKKIDEIAKDPDKKKNFMRGLEIINASSGIKPIGQATSTVGAISKGLLKAEKAFTAEDIARLKAENKNLNKNYSRKDLAMNADFKDYNEIYKSKQGDFRSTELIYSMAKKAANEGKELPTGIIQKSFAGFEKAITEIPGGAKILDGLLKRNEGTTKMSSEDAVVFKDLLQSAVKQKIVSRVKELYPVSNKDIEILLQTVGDVGTSPEALRRLIAMQMGIQDIEKTQKTFVNELYSDGDMNFRDNSLAMSEKQLFEKYKKEVRPETLEALYGKDYKDITAAGMVSAKYYQDLETKFAEDNPESFYNIFTDEQTKKQEDILTQIKKFQGKEDLPPGGEPN